MGRPPALPPLPPTTLLPVLGLLLLLLVLLLTDAACLPLLTSRLLSLRELTDASEEALSVRCTALAPKPIGPVPPSEGRPLAVALRPPPACCCCCCAAFARAAAIAALCAGEGGLLLEGGEDGDEDCCRRLPENDGLRCNDVTIKLRTCDNLTPLSSGLRLLLLMPARDAAARVPLALEEFDAEGVVRLLDDKVRRIAEEEEDDAATAAATARLWWGGERASIALTPLPEPVPLAVDVAVALGVGDDPLLSVLSRDCLRRGITLFDRLLPGLMLLPLPLLLTGTLCGPPPPPRVGDCTAADALDAGPTDCRDDGGSLGAPLTLLTFLAPKPVASAYVGVLLSELIWLCCALLPPPPPLLPMLMPFALVRVKALLGRLATALRLLILAPLELTPRPVGVVGSPRESRP